MPDVIGYSRLAVALLNGDAAAIEGGRSVVGTGKHDLERFSTSVDGPP